MARSFENATDEQLYEERLSKLLAGEALPSSISEIRHEVGTDHTGEPAVRLLLVMDPEFQANFDREQSRRKELQDFAFELESKLLSMDPTYFPFVNLAGAE